MSLMSCWNRVAIHQTSQPHPSRPSSVEWHTSMNKTVWTLVFMYFRAHWKCLYLWALVRSGRNAALCTAASLWRILHWEFLGTPESTAQQWLFIAALWITLIPLTENLLNKPLSHRNHLCFESLTNLFIVQWSLFMIFYLKYQWLQIFHTFYLQKDRSSSPYGMKTVACLIMWNNLFK